MQREAKKVAEISDERQISATSKTKVGSNAFGAVDDDLDEFDDDDIDGIYNMH